MKRFLESKYFFMIISSLVALVLASIEYVVISFATKYSFIPMLISIAIFIGLFIFAFVFKKNQTKMNLLLLVFILIWSITLCVINRGNIEVGSRWITSSNDKISITKFIFPGILEEVQYTYNSTTEALGTVVRRQFIGIDLNLLISMGMLVFSTCIGFFKYKKEVKREEVKEFSPTKIKESPYSLMVIVSSIGLILSSIECILLTISSTATIIAMVIGSVIFAGLFVYILISQKKKIPYNFLLVVFLIFWVTFLVNYLALAMTQTNNGKIYYKLGFVFPCIITKSSFEYSTNELISTKIVYGYLNWLISFVMLVITSLILYIKEKALFQALGKRDKTSKEHQK
ncbi:MAG: hypothetical protein K2J20_05485 [Bacilli bacterium]|nr:hypothetical protein [Bacilli bacterium]